MRRNQRRRWLVAGSLFAALFFVFGSGYNTAGVFVDPLTRHFGWTRAQVSLLQTVLALSAGLTVPPVGWLLDKIEARMVIGVGAALAGTGFLMAGTVDGFGPMVIAYGLLGVGIGAATVLPASLVISNWFEEQRALAMGIAMSGTSIGGMVMTFVASRTIASGGWRLGYLILALPMFLVVIPLVAAFVRTRPPHSRGANSANATSELEGLEIAQALRSKSFWFVAVAQFLSASAIAGTNLHAVPYLTGIGYSPARAALTLSMVLGLAAAGKLAMGFMADRIGARVALALGLVLAAGGLAILQLASKTGMLAAFIIFYGLGWGVPFVLLPVVLAEAVGLKRLGSLLGLMGVFTTLGGASGPVVAGRLFDLTGSYIGAFYLFAAALLLGAAAIMGCEAPVTEKSKVVAVYSE